MTDSNKDDLLKLAVEASPNGMVVVGAAGEIIMINASIETLFGYRRAELIGQPIEILVPQRFQNQHPQLRNSYLSLPETRAMGLGRELYGLHKNGTEIPVEIGLNPITVDGQTMIIAAIVDITERHRAQEMIRLAVEAAPNGMIMTDTAGLITMVNSQIEILFGYAREELIGKNIDTLVPQRFQADHPNLRKSYYTDPVSRAMGRGRDLYALHRNGREFPVEIGLNPLHTEQGTMILASVVDITERKQQEEQLKSALREKEVLLSEIHHRVKNNLQIIDSLIGIQSDMVSGENALAALLNSQNRVRSIAMIHQLLYESNDFSKVSITDVMSGLIDNLIQIYDVDYHQVQVKLDIAPVYLSIDQSIPFGLIVNELVSNTFKHAFPNQRTGTLKVTLTPNGQWLKLVLEDSGIGIPDSFDVDTADSLGLMLVKTLADQLNGELTIQHNNPTRFTLEFHTPLPPDEA